MFVQQFWLTIVAGVMTVVPLVVVVAGSVKA